MVVLHLRRHLQLPKAREFLVWHPLATPPPMDRFMRQLVPAAGFDGVLDIRDFENLRPRTQGAAAWWIESARRFRKDALEVRRWLSKRSIEDTDLELWADDPIHFNSSFLKGLLRDARQVKFPHSFNHEDSTTPDYRARLAADLRAVSIARRILFTPWLKWLSGVDNGPEPRLRYSEAYTFDRPSPWAPGSIDVSRLISIEAFRQTAEGLPASVKSEVEEMLAPIVKEGKPIILLLLFGLSSSMRVAYQNALSRLMRDRAGEFERSTLVVKSHPGAPGDEEERSFFRWLTNLRPTRVFFIRHPLNLEFLLPEMNLAYVLAGPCGALPIVRRLKSGRPIVLPEIMDEMARQFPRERKALAQLVAGMEAW